MASHQQLLYHIVFSTKERRPLLKDADFREGVWSYMAGTASNLGGHALRIGGYIENQMQHHSKQSFQDEYLRMLADHDIAYDLKYLWE